MPAQIAVQLAVHVPHEHRGAGPHVRDAELLLQPVERRDRAARALAAQEPRVAALGVDALVQRQLDQLVGLRRRRASRGPAAAAGPACRPRAAGTSTPRAAGPPRETARPPRGTRRGTPLRAASAAAPRPRRSACGDRARSPSRRRSCSSRRSNSRCRSPAGREPLRGRAEQPLRIVGQRGEFVEHGTKLVSDRRVSRSSQKTTAAALWLTADS